MFLCPVCGSFPGIRTFGSWWRRCRCARTVLIAERNVTVYFSISSHGTLDCTSEILVRRPGGRVFVVLGVTGTLVRPVKPRKVATELAEAVAHGVASYVLES